MKSKTLHIRKNMITSSFVIIRRSISQYIYLVINRKRIERILN